MKKILITALLGLFTLTSNGQSVNEENRTIAYDINKDLYIVHTDDNNYHHVTKDGVLHGSFSHTFNNIVVIGYMKNGKRHGSMVTYVDDKKISTVKYDNGKVLAVTKFLD
jgi:hypothetical protein